jgi:hypothetical protein
VPPLVTPPPVSALPQHPQQQQTAAAQQPGQRPAQVLTINDTDEIITKQVFDKPRQYDALATSESW